MHGSAAGTATPKRPIIIQLTNVVMENKIGHIQEHEITVRQDTVLGCMGKRMVCLDVLASVRWSCCVVNNAESVAGVADIPNIPVACFCAEGYVCECVVACLDVCGVVWRLSDVRVRISFANAVRQPTCDQQGE